MLTGERERRTMGTFNSTISMMVLLLILQGVLCTKFKDNKGMGKNFTKRFEPNHIVSINSSNEGRNKTEPNYTNNNFENEKYFKNLEKEENILLRKRREMIDFLKLHMNSVNLDILEHQLLPEAFGIPFNDSIKISNANLTANLITKSVEQNSTYYLNISKNYSIQKENGNMNTTHTIKIMNKTKNSIIKKEIDFNNSDEFILTNKRNSKKIKQENLMENNDLNIKREKTQSESIKKLLDIGISIFVISLMMAVFIGLLLLMCCKTAQKD
jgi:hypothetical protein